MVHSQGSPRHAPAMDGSGSTKYPLESFARPRTQKSPMSPSRPDRSPRDELVAIALDLLDHHHPEDLSLREVARRAGLTSGAPAHHFGNKLGLLAACAEVAWSELCTRMEAVGEGAEPDQALRSKVQAYVDYAIEHPGPYRLITSRRFEDAEHFVQITEWRKRAIHTIIALIPPDPSDPKLPWRRAAAVWALLHGHVTLVLDGAVETKMVDFLTHDIGYVAVVIAMLPREAT